MLRESTVLSLIDRWIAGGLVPVSSRDTMVADVEQTRWVLNPVVIVVSIACGLLALAVIAQLAMNWQQIPKFARLLLLCLGLISLYGCAVWRLVRAGAEDLSLHVFAFLGVMFYGAAVLLVSQMFHIGGSVSGWLLVWLLGAILTTFVLSSRLVLNLTLVLAGIWATTVIMPDVHLLPLSAYIWKYGPMLAFLLVPVLWYRSQIAVVLWQILLFGWLDILIFDHHGDAFFGIMLSVGAMILLHLVAWLGMRELPSSYRWPARVSEVLHYGVMLTGACIIIWLIQQDNIHSWLWPRYDFSPVLWQGWRMLIVVAGIMLVVLGWMATQLYRKRLSRIHTAMGILFLSLSGCLLLYPRVDGDQGLPFLYHVIQVVLLLGVLILMILNGSREGRRGPMVVGSLLLATTCVVVYIAWDFAHSALLFFLTGLALLLGSKLVRRLVS